MAKRKKKKAAPKNKKLVNTPHVFLRKEPSVPLASIKVIGVGGGGGNAVERMSKNFVRGVEFIAVNTDHQDLDHCEVRRKLYIGKNLTRGLGAGMNPELGERAAEENRSDIAESLKGADLVFVTAGFGGGTGSGAAPVIAEVAKQQGALTFAVVTRPFAFEGGQRERIASEAIARLKDRVDAMIVVPNDRIFSVISKDTPVTKAFEKIDDILRNALMGIVELIVTPGIINIDFADIRAVVQDAGHAIVGVGVASGQDRAQNAVQSAIHSPLLEFSAEGARGIVLGIAGSDLTMAEINESAKLISQTADPSARIIFGTYRDRNLKPKQMKVVVIATGFNGIQNGNSLFGGRNSDRPFFGGFGEEKSSAGREEVRIVKDEQAPLASDDVDKKKKGFKNPAEEKQSDKEDSYPWDIPTFLRKRRK